METAGFVVSLLVLAANLVCVVMQYKQLRK
jgi:hypothetical protein